jgi:hypothetical protein
MKRIGWLGASVIECDCAQFIIVRRLHELGGLGFEFTSHPCRPTKRAPRPCTMITKSLPHARPFSESVQRPWAEVPRGVTTHTGSAVFSASPVVGCEIKERKNRGGLRTGAAAQ